MNADLEVHPPVGQTPFMSQMSAPSQDVRLYRALKQHFGFDAFRPGQQGVVRDALEGRDVLAIMPTGGGKSLCFQLPALLRPGLTLVVSPLIALMQDQVRQLRANGIPADLLNSAQDAAASAEVMRQLDQGALKLLYVAPERLLMDGFLSRLTRHGSLSMLVVDEAHCVSEWGHDFRPEYRQLHRVREAFPEVPVLAFTATATPRVRDDIGVQLHLNAPALHLASFNRGNLFYAVEEKTRDAYTRVREQARRGGSGIVYCGSRRRVDELAARLADDGVEALPYHAGLGAEVRREHQERFIGDAAQVMVATVAFGMGINKPDVRWVIHYDLPKTLEAYYQEAGRAGRDGEPGECTLLYSPGDIHSAEQLIRNKVHPATGEPLEQEQRIARQQLREVIDYAESAVCRRVVQLRYFGETFEPPCGQCDNCIAPRPVSDCTIAAQQLLSAVARLAQRGERFGSTYVIDILRGARTEKLLSNGHDRLSVYGLGKGQPVAWWRQVVRALLHQGLLSETTDGFPVLRLRPESRDVLRGERKVEIALRPIKPPKAPRASHSAVLAEGPDAALFEHLRQLRLQLARDQGVPPYVIFNDASLHAMAVGRPTTPEAFAAMPGVGTRKLEAYGAAFTAAILAFGQGPA